VFEVTPTGAFHACCTAFSNPPTHGWGPAGALVIDSAGDLFGTTYAGGSSNAWGTVFEYSAAGAFTILKSFSPGGALPRAGAYLEAGKLYGTAAGDDSEANAGAVYEVGVTNPLYDFTGGPDGGQPMGGVIGDGKGNLFGTASTGGSGPFGVGNGVVFELNIATGQETVLHTFTGVARMDLFRQSALARDAQGNLYGTTTLGGAYGFGTVFELSPSGTLTILHSFTGGIDVTFAMDGQNPTRPDQRHR
jgi:uncharacterized repeat protein (TIGR03803 family)